MGNIPDRNILFRSLCARTGVNLNGTWDFELDLNNSGLERGFGKGRILRTRSWCPSALKSELSGVGYTDFIAAVWYHRTVTVSAEQLQEGLTCISAPWIMTAVYLLMARRREGTREAMCPLPWKFPRF